MKSSRSKGISFSDDGMKIKSEMGDDSEIYSSSGDDSEGGPKVNVEKIEEMIFDSDSEDEDGGGGDGGPSDGVKKERMPIMFPLRVERSRHEEKVAPPPIFKDPETGKKGGVGRRRAIKIEEGEGMEQLNIALTLLSSLIYINPS